jgi:4-hydroxy-3-methylbut-2-enyl diphosphate reductase IspH
MNFTEKLLLAAPRYCAGVDRAVQTVSGRSSSTSGAAGVTVDRLRGCS